MIHTEYNFHSYLQKLINKEENKNKIKSLSISFEIQKAIQRRVN